MTEELPWLHPVPQLASIPVSWGSELSLAVLEPGWVRQRRADHGNTSVVPVSLAVCRWCHHGRGHLGFSRQICPAPVFRAAVLLGIATCCRLELLGDIERLCLGLS